jgi:hypothetical protein
VFGQAILDGEHVAAKKTTNEGRKSDGKGGNRHSSIRAHKGNGTKITPTGAMRSGE